MENVRYISVLTVFITSLMYCDTINAQRASSLRISEVMTNNHNSIVDEYGQNSPWIEIYNSSSSTVDLKGCYLTNDPNNLKLHRIPLWSTNTKVGPRQYIVLWGDGNVKKGVFHLGFELSKYKSNFLALVDADGKTIINVSSIPIIPQDYSYQVFDINNIANNSNVKWRISSNPSPLEPNEDKNQSSKVENLAKLDPSGVIMTTTAIAVVFIALLTLSIVFTLIGKTLLSSSKRKQGKNINNKKQEEEKIAVSLAISQYLSLNNEHIVAISLAVHQEKNTRNYDNNMKLTIKRKSTQWNDKVYNMRNYMY